MVEWLDEHNDKFEYFSPFHSSQPIWNGRAPKDCSPADRHQVFTDNYSNVEWADILSAWVGPDKNPDTGLSWEMGYAFASSTPVLAYIDEQDERQNLNLMLAQSVEAVALGFDRWCWALLEFHENGEFPPELYPEGKFDHEDEIVQ